LLDRVGTELHLPLSLPAIAERLELSQRTLETYVTSARKKLGAKTSTEAVAIAIRLRLI